MSTLSQLCKIINRQRLNTMASYDTLNVSALLEQIEAVAKNPPSDVVGDDSTRRKLRDAARNLSVALETPADSVHRIAHLVQLMLPGSTEPVHSALFHID